MHPSPPQKKRKKWKKEGKKNNTPKSCVFIHWLCAAMLGWSCRRGAACGGRFLSTYVYFKSPWCDPLPYFPDSLPVLYLCAAAELCGQELPGKPALSQGVQLSPV